MTYINNPNQLSLGTLKSIIEIIGIFDISGKYFKKKYSDRITQEEIENILFQIQSDDDGKVSERRIKTAREIFNSVSKNFKITGSKKGTKIQPKTSKISQDDLRNDPGYETLIILFLALSRYNQSFHLDILRQMNQADHPLGDLVFLDFAIQNRLSICFKYSNNRNPKKIIQSFVPVKLNLREGHWLLIGWNMKDNFWNQYLLHSIECIEPEFESGGDDKKINQKIPDFNLEEFYKNSFGIATYQNKEPLKVTLEVPKDLMSAIRKRREQGI